MSAPLFARLAEIIDARFAEEVAFLAELVKVPSDNPPGDCAPHAARTAELLKAMGFAVEHHPVPVEVCKAHGMISATNLVVRERFGDGTGPVVALNAHGDVVPPGEGWTTDPYGAEVRDGWMYGRGVAVSKSDFATYAFALRALKDAGAPINGTVELHLTYDEEVGGLIGPGRLLAEGISRPDFAICAAFSHEVIVAHNGCLHLEITLRGKSAHAARPDTGHDALEAATAVLNALYAHRASLGTVRSATPGITTPSLVVGLIKGGINTNVVPDLVTLRVDRRIIPEEDASAVEAGLRALVAEAVAGLDGISAQVDRILLVNPLGPVPGSDRLAAIVGEEASAVMGKPVPPKGVPIYADARLYSEAGVPTVMYGAGPASLLDANGHRADERVPLEDLRRATHVVARAVARLCGG